MKSSFRGASPWWVQRASAAYMLLFIVFVVGALSSHPIQTFEQWRPWVARPGMSVAVLLFFVALLSHLWVGLRDVLLDYARPAGLRRVLLSLVAAGLVGAAAWVVVVLARLRD